MVVMNMQENPLYEKFIDKGEQTQLCQNQFYLTQNQTHTIFQAKHNSYHQITFVCRPHRVTKQVLSVLLFVIEIGLKLKSGHQNI
jgi:hypothetical protein